MKQVLILFPDLLINGEKTNTAKVIPFGYSHLTAKQQYGYDNKTTAKNGGQILHSELKKMHSRILLGFFCACKICYVMTCCIEELSSSPYSFFSGSVNSVQPVTLRFTPKLTVSQMKKETVLCL